MNPSSSVDSWDRLDRRSHSHAPTSNPRHTGNPPGSCLGGTFAPGVRRPILARLCRAAGRLYGRPAASWRDAIAARCGQAMQRKWWVRTTTTSSICSRQRKSLTFAGYRGERSIERSRVANCERRGSATGSASIRWSWSAGLPRKRRLLPRRCRGQRSGLSARRDVAACERCLMSNRGVVDER